MDVPESKLEIENRVREENRKENLVIRSLCQTVIKTFESLGIELPRASWGGRSDVNDIGKDIISEPRLARTILVMRQTPDA